MRVLCLDCRLGIDADDYSFGSTISLYDYDVVIWDPANSLEDYTLHSTTYMGLPSLATHKSAALQRDVARRRTEFLEFINLGRTLIVFVPGATEVYIDTGERQHSGTGRNRATTKIVKEFDIMKAVPANIELKPAAGFEMEAASDLIGPLFRRTPGAWLYRSVLEKEDTLRPLLHVKGTRKIVSGMIRQKNSGGLLLLLPDLILDDSDEDAGGTEESAGESSSLRDASLALLDWVRSLTTEEEAKVPDWASRFLFASELERTERRSKLEAELSETLARLDLLKAEEAQEAQWKVLIHGGGESLERQVARAFEVFGFTLEDTVKGRSDLRAVRGDARAVVEVKGLAKSAGEKHAAQLEKWVSDELANGKPAKGILVVNAWRDIPVDERREDVFPDQMLAYSAQRNHCLVSGLQLLAMARACIADPSRADELASLLLETTGRISGWDDASRVFEATTTDEVSVGKEADLPSAAAGQIEGESAEEEDPKD
ncbi:hypothetical protein E9549_11080 [Blastococcus sp. MG754426]|uniref:hypothetical protein n=1 Tax=unclassified Blastococcus TaxID=2619396 RepID=UPI001EF0F479|nr:MULTISPECIES: hypothetical protein [unclassified Blastococcus]MCF6507941.1 hypothetical protein [Blastococcus sp. MG754426]MCF6512523.1 hypothetical protein [Blastococcus sp. MG754427]